MGDHATSNTKTLAGWLFAAANALNRAIHRALPGSRLEPKPSFSGWLRGRVSLAPDERTPERFLYRDYVAWMEVRGASPVSRSQFSDALGRAGICSTGLQRPEGRIRAGVRLKPCEPLMARDPAVVQWMPPRRLRRAGGAR